MLGCPLDDQPQRARRNVTTNNNQCMNINYGFVLAVFRVKVCRKA